MAFPTTAMLGLTLIPLAAANGIEIFVFPTAGLMAKASIGGQKLKFAPLKE